MRNDPRRETQLVSVCVYTPIQISLLFRAGHEKPVPLNSERRKVATFAPLCKCNGTLTPQRQRHNTPDSVLLHRAEARHYCVTAPRLALLTVRAYFASTPRCVKGLGAVHFFLRRVSSAADNRTSI
jgi:hypothetical protein